MKLLINGQDTKRSMSNDTAIVEALQLVQDEYVPNNEVVTTVLVDDQALTVELLEQWKDKTVNDFSEANIKTATRCSYAACGLQTMAAELSKTEKLRELIAEMIIQGKTQSAMETLTEYLTTWNAVHNTLGSACRVMDLSPETLEFFDDSGISHSVNDIICDLTRQLDELRTALAANDLVLVGDIVDYEFGDICSLWQKMLCRLADIFDPQM